MTTDDQFYRFVLIGAGHTIIVWRQAALLDDHLECRAIVLTRAQAGEMARAILAGAPMTVKWGVSVVDWRAHAINDHYDHPGGVFTAECGHVLMTVTTLRETPHGQKPCETCMAVVTPGATAGTAVPP